MFGTANYMTIWLGEGGMKVRTHGLRSLLSFRSSRVTLTTSVVLLTLCKPVMADIISCPEALYLVNESSSRFSQITGDVESEFGGITSTLELSGAQYCVIVGDAVKDTYRCTWKYPYRDELAGMEFEKLALEFASCLGNQVEMREDQAVNHPDSYESFLFTLPWAEARVTLKDKRELDSTFVSFVIEARREAKSSVK